MIIIQIEIKMKYNIDNIFKKYNLNMYNLLKMKLYSNNL